MQPKVALIWLCWNNLRHLPEVVASWERLTYSKDRLTILVLPAHSPDGIAEVVRRDVLPRSGKDLPEIVMLDEENRGFTVNNNVGMQWALERGYDYIFLENGDLKLAPDTLDEAVAQAERDASIGAVQSLVCFWHEPEKVNVSGGVVHVGGYGYARDNGTALTDIAAQDGEDIAYPSGAAVLYRSSALRRVGLFEEGFFMYHEDLELGLRLQVAGYRTVLARNSLAYHDYQFGRNTKMFVWMEVNRWIVLLGYLKPLTIALLAPLWCMLEIGSWAMMFAQGTAGVKVEAYKTWCTSRPWKVIAAMRRRTRALRVISDRQLTRLWTGNIEAQAVANPLLDCVVNPVVDSMWRVLHALIVW